MAAVPKFPLRHPVVFTNIILWVILRIYTINSIKKKLKKHKM